MLLKGILEHRTIFIKYAMLHNDMAGVKITYETLFDLLRREKSRNDLQELEGTFFVDVLTYLKEKKATLSDGNRNSALFSAAENEKIKIQLKNINKILDELYEIRQKKIINAAVHKSKTNSNLIDTSKMLIEEHTLFLETYTLLNRFKRDILGNLLGGELPYVHGLKPPEPINSSNDDDEEEESEKEKSGSSENLNSEPQKVESVAKKPVTSSANQKIKFIANLPKFMGLDKKVYGPFKINDVSEVPSDLAEMLIKKGRAQVLES